MIRDIEDMTRESERASESISTETADIYICVCVCMYVCKGAEEKHGII